MSKNVPTNLIPNHIGFIVDGNRRWARSNSLSIYEGHKIGYDNLIKIVDVAFKKGIPYVSAYVFSSENWNRAQDEVSHLMELAYKMAQKDVKKLHKKGCKVVYLGSKSRISNKLKEVISNAEKLTRNNTGGVLALCFNYGGQDEIIDSVKKIVKQKIAPSKINKEIFSQYIYHPQIPQLDLVIRSSGEQRLSNFMLWRAAYAELIFSKVHWPDFNEAELNKCLAVFAKRQRRFGV